MVTKNADGPDVPLCDLHRHEFSDSTTWRSVSTSFGLYLVYYIYWLLRSLVLVITGFECGPLYANPTSLVADAEDRPKSAGSASDYSSSDPAPRSSNPPAHSTSSSQLYPASNQGTTTPSSTPTSRVRRVTFASPPHIRCNTACAASASASVPRTSFGGDQLKRKSILRRASFIGDWTTSCGLEESSSLIRAAASEARTSDTDLDATPSLSDEWVPPYSLDDVCSIQDDAVSAARTSDAEPAAKPDPGPCAPVITPFLSSSSSPSPSHDWKFIHHPLAEIAYAHVDAGIQTHATHIELTVAPKPESCLPTVSLSPSPSDGESSPPLLEVPTISGDSITRNLGALHTPLSGLEVFVSRVGDLPSAASLLNQSLSESPQSHSCRLFSQAYLALPKVETVLIDSQAWTAYELAARRCLNELTVLLDHYEAIDDSVKHLSATFLTGLWDTTQHLTVAHAQDCPLHLALAEDIFRQILRLAALWDFNCGSWISLYSRGDLHNLFIPTFLLATQWLRFREAAVSLDALPFAFGLWFYRPPYFIHDKEGIYLLYDILGISEDISTADFLDSAGSSVYETVFQEFDADTIARRICDDLNDSLLVDERLSGALGGLQGFFRTRLMGSRFFTLGLCESIVAAFRRQQNSGLEEHHANAWNEATLIICQVLGCSKTYLSGPTDSADAILGGLLSSGVLELVAYGLMHRETSSKTPCNVFALYFKMLMLNAQAASRTKDGAPAKSLHYLQFRQELRKIWLPGLDSLDSASLADDEDSDCDSIRDEWRSLGIAAGFDEKKERARFNKFGGSVLPSRCAWDQCEHSTRKPSGRLLACKGCGEVVYCSRQCQVSHWKEGGHKQVCRRVKDH